MDTRVPTATPATPSSTHCGPASTLRTTGKLLSSRSPDQLCSIGPLQLASYWASLQRGRLPTTPPSSEDPSVQSRHPPGL